MRAVDLGSAERAVAELALRRLRREHPDKWREAVRGEAAVAGWFEDAIRDAYLQSANGAEIIGAVVQLAIMDERRKEEGL